MIVVRFPHRHTSLLRWPYTHCMCISQDHRSIHLRLYIMIRVNTNSTVLGLPFILSHAYCTLVSQLTEENRVICVRNVCDSSTMCLRRVYNKLVVGNSYDYRTTLTWLFIVMPSCEACCNVTLSVKHRTTVGSVFYIRKLRHRGKSVRYPNFYDECERGFSYANISQRIGVLVLRRQ